MCLCWVSWWVWWVSSLSCPIICVLSLVLSHISCVTVLNVSLLSVMVRVSSVKCLMSCPMICVSFGLSCPISLVPLHCDVSLLSVSCLVLSHNMCLVMSHNTICVVSLQGMCLCGVSGWEWWVSGVMSQHTDTLVTAPDTRSHTASGLHTSVPWPAHLTHWPTTSH